MFISKNNRRYDLRVSPADERDYIYQYTSNKLLLLLSPPKPIDLRPNMPTVFDQGTESSCSANAVAAVGMYDECKEDKPVGLLSRQFQYFNSRLIEGSTKDDSGSTMRDAVKAFAKYGICTEELWPYSKPFNKSPDAKAYQQAIQYKATQYFSVPQKLEAFRQALSNGLPVIGGIQIYESFESDEVATTGNVPLPNSNEEYLGGHAQVIVGDIPDKKVFIVRNSWGINWGDKGYSYQPYEYWLSPNLASDFWVVTWVN